jgi:hypothetical protein
MGEEDVISDSASRELYELTVGKHWYRAASLKIGAGKSNTFDQDFVETNMASLVTLTAQR